MATEIGQRVGDYEVLALLGAGGMGRVYKVRNIISNREEAMKFCFPTSPPILSLRLASWPRSAPWPGWIIPTSRNCAPRSRFENQFVMIMEYVEGTTLEKLAAQAPIPRDECWISQRRCLPR